MIRQNDTAKINKDGLHYEFLICLKLRGATWDYYFDVIGGNP